MNSSMDRSDSSLHGEPEIIGWEETSDSDNGVAGSVSPDWCEVSLC